MVKKRLGTLNKKYYINKVAACSALCTLKVYSLAALMCSFIQNIYYKYQYFLTGFLWFSSIIIYLFFFEISCLPLGERFVL